MKEYLASSKYIDFDHPLVKEKANALAKNASDELSLAQACYEFVRDEIQHSWDYKKNPVTCKASDVLIHGTGYCYAKSHLLAALLRANGIPAGLCYQRLSIGDDVGPPYSLHGLNAVYLADFGWYRIDARGNKNNVSAAFCPPKEVLAYPVRRLPEYNFPEIYAEPLPVVIHALETNLDVESVHANLPDMDVESTRS
jgi:transglutaminase-like putative cysteine protease